MRPGGALAVDRARAVHGVRGGGLLDHPRLRFQHGNEQIDRHGTAQIEQPGTAEVFLRAGNPHLEPVLFAAFGNGVFAGAPLEDEQLGLALRAFAGAGDQHHFVELEVPGVEIRAGVQQFVDLENAPLPAVGGRIGRVAGIGFAQRDLHADTVVLGFGQARLVVDVQADAGSQGNDGEYSDCAFHVYLALH